MEYNDFFINCIYVDAILWIMFFIYSIIKFFIKKIKYKETDVSIMNIICFVILAICSSIFGPVTLAFVTVFVLAWILSVVIPFLWNHGLETVFEWLCSTKI